MLNNAEKVALSKIMKDNEVKTARKELKAGDVKDIDVTVRVKGTLSIGADFSKEMPQSVFSKAFLACCLNKLNDATALFMINTMSELLMEKITDPEAAEKKLNYDKMDLKPQLRKAFDALMAETETNVSGSASFKGVCIPVEVNTKETVKAGDLIRE